MSMNRLEKVAGKKALIEGLKAHMASAKGGVKSFMTAEKHRTKRHIAAGVAGTGAAALLLKRLLKSKSKGLSSAGIKNLLKSNKGKVIAGGAGGVGLGALLSNNS
jgi:hypothetical protein